MNLSGRQVPGRSRGLIPQDGYLHFETFMSSPKPPSFLESARASLTSSGSTIASTSHSGSSIGGVSLNGHRVPEQSRGLFPQDGSLPFEPFVRSPKPPSCSESARASLTASDIVSANNGNHGSGGGGIGLKGWWFPEKSGGLFTQNGSLPFDSSVSYPKPQYWSDINHDSLTTSTSASTGHCDSVGGGVSTSEHRVPKVIRGFPYNWLASVRSLKEVWELS